MKTTWDFWIPCFFLGRSRNRAELVVENELRRDMRFYGIALGDAFIGVVLTGEDQFTDSPVLDNGESVR